MGELDAGAIYQLLGTVAADVRQIKAELATKASKADLANKADKTDIADLRSALTTYHSAVLGHGILISELEERLRRLERHVGLAPVA
jgi:hypothetical protein